MSASQELLIEVPEGSVNSMRQPLTVELVPLVTVTRPSWPVPQSCTLANVAVTLPAADAVVMGTAATASATTAPVAHRARRSDLFIRRPSNS